MADMQAGAAQRVITPPLGAAMAGYFEPHHAEEVIANLHARALAVLDARGASIAIVACDVLALPADAVARIRDRVAEAAPIPPDRILVCATHNHTGPQTAEIFGQPADAAYMDMLVQEAADAVIEALANAAPAELVFGTAIEDRINTNRRVVMRDGSVHTHTTDADLNDEVGREGPADPELGVLAVKDDQYSRALLVNYALHPTNVRGDRICPDYPGYLAEILQPDLRGEAVTVFCNGACGNLDSKTPFLNDAPYGPGRAERIACILADAVRRALETPAPLHGDTVCARSETVRLPLKEVSPEQIAAARAVLAQDAPKELVFTRGTRRPSPLKERIYAAEALRMAEMTAKQPWVDAEIQLLAIGDLAVVGAPVELFTEFGLEIKRVARQRFPHVIVVELANGYFGYVPTPESFEGGGYETRLAVSSPLKPEAGDLIVQAATRLLLA